MMSGKNISINLAANTCVTHEGAPLEIESKYLNGCCRFLLIYIRNRIQLMDKQSLIFTFDDVWSHSVFRWFCWRQFLFVTLSHQSEFFQIVGQIAWTYTRRNRNVDIEQLHSIYLKRQILFAGLIKLYSFVVVFKNGLKAEKWHFSVLNLSSYRLIDS